MVASRRGYRRLGKDLFFTEELTDKRPAKENSISLFRKARGVISGMHTVDRVSIVTPSYNSERFIKESIESVLSQTYKNWEMLIVDDGSTDDSPSVIERYVSMDDRIRLIRLNQNSGVAVARNTAIAEAKGRYIAFLDSDDLWMPEKLEKQLQFMEEKNAEVTSTAYFRMDEFGNIKDGVVTVPERTTYSALLKSNVIGCLTAMYDISKVGKVYMSKVGHEDYTLWLRILKMGYDAYGLALPLAIYRVRDASVSGNKLKAAKYQWKIYREIEKLSLLDSLICFLQYAYHGLGKWRRIPTKGHKNEQMSFGQK